MIHFAGPSVEINAHLRQRCAWCGAVLIDYELRNVAVLVGQSGVPGTWEVGALVEVDSGLSYVVEHAVDNPLPDGTCAALDPAATR